MERFSIDPDIKRAQTPPAWVYREAEAFTAARERIFAPSWQFLAGDDVVRVPGEHAPLTLLEGMLDEPLVLVRDGEDTLRCLSNVCTHRGNLVVEGRGIAKSLRCRYHGRRFGLDGALQHMPEFSGVCGFPGPEDDLRALPLERLGPLLFTTLGRRDDFAAFLGPMSERIGWMNWEGMRRLDSGARDYLVRANWALYVENYLEGFHIPFVHAGLAESLSYDDYGYELFPTGVLQLGIGKGSEGCFELPATSPDHGRRVAAYYYWFFPNLMLNFYPWGLSLNLVRPVGPELRRVSFIPFVIDASRMDQGAGAAIDRVEREDEAIVEAVQRGLRSRIYSRGRYSPTQERGTHHFHRMLAAALFGPES